MPTHIVGLKLPPDSSGSKRCLVGIEDVISMKPKREREGERDEAYSSGAGAAAAVRGSDTGSRHGRGL